MSSAVHGDARLRASDAVVAWCVRNAERRLRLRDAEQAGIIAYVAAATAAELGHSWLCAAPLEDLLTAIGRTLPDASPLHRPARPRRWLHVLTISAPIGGHTALARRWIARTPGRRRHDVALTAQAVRDADPALCRAAASSGGIVRSVSDVTSLLGRAAALRALAADVEAVVLHVHMWDVLPSLAFAAPGGPVVLLMNHADHAFWVGAAVADAVVDFRDSGLALTQRLRAARASRLLPVPLEERPAVAADRTALAGRVPADALARRTLLLTIGRGAKYQSHPSLDFPAAARRIVQGLGDCTLLAVGPSTDDALWRELSRATDGRALAVGEHADLAAWTCTSRAFPSAPTRRCSRPSRPAARSCASRGSLRATCCPSTTARWRPPRRRWTSTTMSRRRCDSRTIPPRAAPRSPPCERQWSRAMRAGRGTRGCERSRASCLRRTGPGWPESLRRCRRRCAPMSPA